MLMTLKGSVSKHGKQRLSPLNCNMHGRNMHGNYPFNPCFILLGMKGSILARSWQLGGHIFNFWLSKRGKSALFQVDDSFLVDNIVHIVLWNIEIGLI
jgi:hypothetical protein